MLFPMIPLQLHDVCHVEVRAFAHAAVASLVRRLLLFAVVDAVQARAIVVFEAIVIIKQDRVPCSLVCFFRCNRRGVKTVILSFTYMPLLT